MSDDIEAELAKLGKRTDTVSADDGLADRVVDLATGTPSLSAEATDVDDRLGALALATSDLRPTRRLADAVDENLGEPTAHSENPESALWRTSGVVLTGLTAAAAACILWAAQTQSAFDEQIIATVDVVEADQ